MLGSCQSPAVGFKDGVEKGPLLGDALSSKTGVGLGTLEGCGDGESDSVLVVGSPEGVELGPQLTEEEGETLGTCDSRAVGSNEGVDYGALLGVAHPMKTGSCGRPTIPTTAYPTRYSMWDQPTAKNWDCHSKGGG